MNSRPLPNNLRKAHHEAQHRQMRLLHKQRVHVHYLFTLDIYLYLSKTKACACARRKLRSIVELIRSFVFVQHSVQIHSDA